MMTTILALALAASLQAAPSPLGGEQQVRGFVEAFNSRNIDGMLALAADNIQWLSVDGPKVTLETEGKDPLRSSMAKYFQQCPTCKSDLLWLKTAGSRVTAHERATWTNKAGATVSQSSLSVYELKDGRIVRVYYFPVERDSSVR
jgi:hypothetical protein